MSAGLRLWGPNLPLIVNAGVVALLLLLAFSVSISDRQVMEQYLDEDRDISALEFDGSIDDERFNVLDVYPAIDAAIRQIEEINHSKTIAAFVNRDMCQLGGQKYECNVQYLNDYAWGQFDISPQTNILLYNSPVEVLPDTISFSFIENQTYSLELAEFVYQESPLYYARGGGEINILKVFMPINALKSADLLDRDDFDVDWNYDGVYYLNDDQITTSTKIRQVRSLIRDLWNEMEDIWAPYANLDSIPSFIGSDLRSDLVYYLESKSGGGPYDATERLMNEFGTVLLLLSLVPLYVFYAIISSRKRLYELAYARGQGHSSLTNGLLIWGVGLPCSILVVSLLFLSFLLSWLGITLNFTLVIFYLVFQTLGSIWIVLMKSRIFQGTTQYRGFIINSRQFIKIPLFPFVIALGIYNIATNLPRTIEISNDFGASFWNFGTAPGLLRDVVFGISLIMLALAFLPLDLKQFSLKEQTRILQKLSGKTWSKRRYYVLFIMILVFYNLSNAVGYEAHFADDGVKVAQPLGDFIVFFNEYESTTNIFLQDLLVDNSLFEALGTAVDFTDYVVLSQIEQDLKVGDSISSVEIQLINQSLYENFVCECLKPDIDFNQGLYVSQSFLNLLDKYEGSVTIDNTVVDTSEFVLLDQQLNFGHEQTNIFTSFSKWQQLELEVMSKYPMRAAVHINADGYIEEQIERAVSTAFALPREFYRVNELEMVQLRDYSWGYFLSAFLLASSIGVMNVYFIYADKDAKDSIVIITTKYGNIGMGQRLWRFIKDTSWYILIAAFLGIVYGLYGNAISTVIFENRLFPFRFDLIFDKLLILFFGFSGIFIGTQLLAISIDRSKNSIFHSSNWEGLKKIKIRSIKKLSYR